MFRSKAKLRRTKANAPSIIISYVEDDSIHHARISGAGEELHDGEPFEHSTLCGASVNFDLCSLNTVDRLVSLDNVVDEDFIFCRACFDSSHGMLAGRRFRR